MPTSGPQVRCESRGAIRLMPLLQAFRSAAIERGLLDLGSRVDAALTWVLVRDMPYDRASDALPETLVDEWGGTCSGKHLLLARLLGELGHRSMLTTALHEFTPVNAPWLPPQL